MVKGYEKINLMNEVNLSISLKLDQRRTHDIELVSKISKRGSFRYNFLTNRVVAKCNIFPLSVINVRTINGFKASI